MYMKFVVMKAEEEFQDPQLASWRPRRADDIVSVPRPLSLILRKSPWFHMCLRAGRGQSPSSKVGRVPSD
jgi:hypothetical protein